MTLSDDTVHVGASSTSRPLPSTPSEVYQPYELPASGAFELELHKKLMTVINRLDNFRIRLDVLDETVKAILEGEDVSDGELLKWFKAYKEQLAKQYREIIK